MIRKQVTILLLTHTPLILSSTLFSFVSFFFDSSCFKYSSFSLIMYVYFIYCYILDYKTGSVPNKKDVLSGLSPQLILEGLILQRGGFNNIPRHEVEKIVFVKLASSEPYLTEIVISDIDFQQQYEGLENLLMHYCQDATYKVSPNEEYAPLYDNYKHLGRKNS